jgi:hypothetical protein
MLPRPGAGVRGRDGAPGGCEDDRVTSAPRSLRSRLPVEWPMIVVLAVAVVGLLRVATAHWREGSVTLGAALLIAAALRAALPPDRAGLLAIRSRVLDILAYSGLGLAVVLLAVTITRGSLTVG